LEYADVLHQMGRVWGGRRDYDQGIDFTHRALTIRTKVLGDDHLMVASSYNNLGVFYESKGDYDKGIEYKEKALRIRIKLLGEVHLDGDCSKKCVKRFLLTSSSKSELPT